MPTHTDISNRHRPVVGLAMRILFLYNKMPISASPLGCLPVVSYQLTCTSIKNFGKFCI